MTPPLFGVFEDVDSVIWAINHAFDNGRRWAVFGADLLPHLLRLGVAVRNIGYNCFITYGDAGVPTNYTLYICTLSNTNITYSGDGDEDDDVSVMSVNQPTQLLGVN